VNSNTFSPRFAYTKLILVFPTFASKHTKMAPLRLLSALASLVAFAQAIPLDNGIQIPADQLEVYFKAGINSYIQSLPAEQILEQQRIATEGHAEAAPQACEDVYLIFARGTFEPGGSDFLGVMVGNPLRGRLTDPLQKQKKSFGATGVDYENGVAGYLSGGDSAGGKKMAAMIEAKASQCPSTKLVISGYSQGAQLVHNGLGYVSGSAKRNIAAVVVFGDPYKGKAIPGVPNSNIFTNCEASDPICMGIPLPIGSHLQYSSDDTQMKKVVNFIVEHVA